MDLWLSLPLGLRLYFTAVGTALGALFLADAVPVTGRKLLGTFLWWGGVGSALGSLVYELHSHSEAWASCTASFFGAGIIGVPLLKDLATRALTRSDKP